MNCRGLAKRVMSPSSATSVAAATSARPRSACSAFTTGVSDQSGSAASMWASEMIPLSRRRLDGRDAIFQHDVMRCVFERQSGEPAPVHQGPGRPVIMTAMAQQKAGELLARLPQHAHRRQSRAHQIADRLMGWVWNHTGDSSPARCNLARLIASRRSVLTRSPGLRGITTGDYDRGLRLCALTGRRPVIKSKAWGLRPSSHARKRWRRNMGANSSHSAKLVQMAEAPARLCLWRLRREAESGLRRQSPSAGGPRALQSSESLGLGADSVH